MKVRALDLSNSRSRLTRYLETAIRVHSP